MVMQSSGLRRRRAVKATAARVSPADTCATFHVDEERVHAVLARMGSGDQFEAAARMFQLLADPTRARLLFALAQAELCVCDLAAIVGRSRPAVSHQLRVLRDLKLVRYRRQGKMAYYSLRDRFVGRLLSQALERERV